MKNMMRFLTSRFAEIFAVNPFDGRILMRFSQCFCGIVIIKYLCTNCLYIFKITHIRMHLRLTAAVDTSSRTAHYP